MSLFEETSSDSDTFSGFSPDTRISPKRSPLKSVVTKVNKTNNKNRRAPKPTNNQSHDQSRVDNKNGDRNTSQQANLIDLDKITPNDIEKLKSVLGLPKNTMPDASNAGMSSLSDNENQFSSSDECDKNLQSSNNPTNVSKFAKSFCMILNNLSLEMTLIRIRMMIYGRKQN